MIESKRYSTYYSGITNEIDVLLSSVNQLDENTKTSPFKNEAIKKLTFLKNSLNDRLISLKDNSDWDTFTVALYGETNAGKSTIIELLRILLGEQTKERERQEYAKTYEKLVLVQEHIDHETINRNAFIRATEEKKTQLNSNLSLTEEEINESSDEWISIQCQIWIASDKLNHKIASSSVCFFKSLFHRLDEQNLILNLKNALASTIEEYKCANDKLSTIQGEIKRIDEDSLIKLESSKTILEKLQLEKNELEEKLISLSDGKIVSASLDFTKKTERYNFTIGKKRLALLDLPGIEGKERDVLEEIERATKKAHVVFYISKNPRTPQKGDSKNKGTIEKIRDHLSGQTEIYFVYNKPAKNSVALTIPLTTEDEETGLAEADSNMKSVFGENYVGHLSISAYLPFVINGCFYEGSFKRSKEKFSATYSRNEILELSGINNFIKIISNELTSGYDKRIINSNLNKISVSISDTKIVVKELQDELKQLIAKINEDLVSTKKQLFDRKDSLMKDLDAEISNKVRAYISFCRSKTYKAVSNNVSNKELTDTFKSILEESKEVLVDNDSIESTINAFKDDANNIVGEHFEYINKLLGFYVGNFGLQLDMDYSINATPKNDIPSIILSLATAIAGLIGSQGWMLVLGIISSIISVGKAIIGHFDSNYKMEQQRKDVDKYLRTIEEDLTENKIEILSTAGAKADNGIEKITEEIEAMERQFNETQLLFDGCISRFDETINSIKREQNDYE